MDPEGTCNVFTFSRSAIKWITSDIKVNYWTYKRDSPGFDEEDDDSFGFDDFQAKLKAGDEEDDFDFEWDGCEVVSDIPSTYKESKAVSLRGNECALRYQVYG